MAPGEIAVIQEQLKNVLKTVSSVQGEMRDGFRDLRSDVKNLNEKVSEIRPDCAAHRERLDDVERRVDVAESGRGNGCVDAGGDSGAPGEPGTGLGKTDKQVRGDGQCGQ